MDSRRSGGHRRVADESWLHLTLRPIIRYTHNGSPPALEVTLDHDCHAAIAESLPYSD